MALVGNAHIIIFPLIVSLLLVLTARAYRYRNEPHGALIPLFGSAALLICTSIASTLVQAYNVYIHLLVVATLHSGLIVAYSAFARMLNTPPPPRGHIAPLVLGASVLTVVALTCDGVRIAWWHAHFPATDMPSFNYPQWYSDYTVRRVDLGRVGAAYWGTTSTFFVCYNLTQALLVGGIARHYLTTLRQPSDHVYLVRRLCCLVGFSVGALGAAAMVVGVGGWAIGQDHVRRGAASVYQLAKISMFILVGAGFVLPRRCWRYPAALVAHLRAWDERRHQAALDALHRVMVAIVPSVVFEVAAPLRDRDQLLIEISDARRLIWSHIPAPQPLTPQAEASVLHRLLREQTVLTTPGTCTPPDLTRVDVMRYNRAVARRLRAAGRAHEEP